MSKMKQPVKAWAIEQENKILTRDAFRQWLLWDNERGAGEFADALRKKSKAIPVIITQAPELSEEELRDIGKVLFSIAGESYYGEAIPAIRKLLTALGMEVEG